MCPGLSPHALSPVWHGTVSENVLSSRFIVARKPKVQMLGQLTAAFFIQPLYSSFLTTVNLELSVNGLPSLSGLFEIVKLCSSACLLNHLHPPINHGS